MMIADGCPLPLDIIPIIRRHISDPFAAYAFDKALGMFDSSREEVLDRCQRQQQEKKEEQEKENKDVGGVAGDGAKLVFAPRGLGFFQKRAMPHAWLADEHLFDAVFKKDVGRIGICEILDIFTLRVAIHALRDFGNPWITRADRACILCVKIKSKTWASPIPCVRRTREEHVIYNEDSELLRKVLSQR